MPYWLRCVENLINDNSNHKTEVIVAENKIDNNNNVATALDQKQYEIQFPNLNLHFTSLLFNNMQIDLGASMSLYEKEKKFGYFE